MEDFVVRSLSSLWFYFISCSKLIFPVLWAVTSITSGSVKEIQKCHFTFLISLVVWIHATAFGAWWHRFVSYGAVVCFLGKTQELSFLEKKNKTGGSWEIEFTCEEYSHITGKTLGVGFEYTGMQVRSFLLTSGHSTGKFILVKYIFKYL